MFSTGPHLHAISDMFGALPFFASLNCFCSPAMQQSLIDLARGAIVAGKRAPSTPSVRRMRPCSVLLDRLVGATKGA